MGGATRDKAGVVMVAAQRLANGFRAAERRLPPAAGLSAACRLLGVTALMVAGAAACGDAPSRSPSTVQPGSSAATAPLASAAVALPRPQASGAVSLEEAIAGRRSVRSFSTRPVSLAQVGQLLWAAQGVTDPVRGYRAAPSAGALYPLEVILVAARVTGLPAGVYRYVPGDHALSPVRASPAPGALADAALSQAAVGEAAAVIVLAAVFERTTAKYGDRGERYAILEAGHAAQNVYLEAQALGLGTVAIGAFDDEAVRRMVGLGDHERPLYLMPCGEPAVR